MTLLYISAWNLFDWFSLVCAFVVIGMFIAVMSMVSALNDSLDQLQVPLELGYNSTGYTDALHDHADL